MKSIIHTFNTTDDTYLKAAAKIDHFSEERIRRVISGLLKVDDFVVYKDEDDSDKNTIKGVNF